MSKDFIDAPNWDEVEKYTKKLVDILHESKLTYIEKDNVLTLLQSVVAREFAMLGIMSFLKEMTEKESKEEKEKLSVLYS